MTSHFKPVIVLGAGFSYNLFQDSINDFPIYPLTNKFTQILRGVLASQAALPDGVPKINVDIVKALNKLLDPLEYDKNNFETILTLLSQEMPWDNEFNASVRHLLYIEIKNFFSEYLAKYSLKKFIEQKESFAQRWQELKNLVQFFHRHEVRVISFNYDLLLEACAIEHSLSYVESEKNSYGFTHTADWINPALIVFEKHSAPLSIVKEFENAPKEPKFKIKNPPSYSEWIEVRINEQAKPAKIFVCIDKNKINERGEGKWESYVTGYFEFENLDDSKIYFKFNAGQARQNLESKINLSKTMPDLSCRIYNSDTGGAVMGVGIDHTARTFKILKLHGSANFFVQKAIDTSMRYQTSYFVPVDHILNHQIDLNDLENRYEPLILPPVLNKQYDIPVIKEMWFHARSALTEATHVIFCGYSIPHTDYMSRALFSEILRSNKRVNIKVFPSRATNQGKEQSNFKSISDLFNSEQKDPSKNYDCYKELNQYLEEESNIKK